MTLTKIVDGVTIELTPEEEAAELARWAAADEEAANRPPLAPIPSLVASASFTVGDGQVDNLSVVSGLPAACSVDAGTYWVFFSEPQPDPSYIVNTSSSQGRVNVATQAEDYFEICVKDDGGALIDPTKFSVSIVRTQ